MPSKNDHLLWKISHQDAPGKVSYLFGSIDKVTPTQQREITRKIIALDEFKNSSFVITDIDYKIGAITDTVPQVREYESVTHGLALQAKIMAKEVYPLDSDDYYDNEAYLSKMGDYLNVYNLLKVGLFAITAPLSIPPYLIYREHYKHKSRERARDAFMNEDSKAIVDEVYQNTGDGTWEHLVTHRNYKWLGLGNYQDEKNPTKIGLLKLFKQENTFVIVPAVNLFGTRNGLLALLKESGYTLTPVNWQERNIEHHTEQKQLDEEKIQHQPLRRSASF